ncbi:MAG: PAS-domain containing protein, partial [Gammaproteobacteria bacterium]|nr:PAS-domain containing protein [Gammaproteobacteria bacterium]
MKSSFEAQITELNEQKTLLESIIDHAPAGIYIKDIEGRYVLCNRTFCDWHDIPFERLEGKTVWDIFGEEKARLFSSKDIECRETKKAIEHESEITYADGMVKSEYTVRFPVLDDRGEILGTGGIDIDISQRKNAEVEVENQKKLLETLIENMDLGVHLFDSNLKIVIANQTSARLMGLPKDFLSPGTSLESIVRYQYEHGELYDTRDSVDEEVDYWLNFRRNAKESYKYERKRPNGS